MIVQKFHSEELNSLYRSSIKVRVNIFVKFTSLESEIIDNKTTRTMRYRRNICCSDGSDWVSSGG